MKIGFIGAGKVGVSLGKYFKSHDIHIEGYYSRTAISANEAADFTQTSIFTSIEALVQNCNIICITVPDGVISEVWEELQMLPIAHKIFIHLSGSLSSAVFTNIERYEAFAYSIHPLYAFHDKFKSHEGLNEAVFTIEGHEKYLDELIVLFESLGNEVVAIQPNDKIRYHTAAAVVSNLYVGIVALGENMLIDCGFTADQAHTALQPLIQGNTENILKYGPKDALTGPIERNDWSTVQQHINALNKEEKEIYQGLSKLILQLAEEKHKDRDYEKIRGILQNEKHSDVISKTKK